MKICCFILSSLFFTCAVARAARTTKDLSQFRGQFKGAVELEIKDLRLVQQIFRYYDLILDESDRQSVERYLSEADYNSYLDDVENFDSLSPDSSSLQ